MEREKNSKSEVQPVRIQAELDIICGPMFSGKSEELIRRIKRYPHGGFPVQAFKPKLDRRRGEKTINSENGSKFPATSIERSIEILNLVRTATAVVAIDEAQFFDTDLPEVCRLLVKAGKRVIVAGLDKDFRGETFGSMGKLKEMADQTDTLHAYCVCCHRKAFRTQRIIINEKGERRAANYSDSVVLIGATEHYEARCLECHDVPGRPNDAIAEEDKPVQINFLISGEGNTEISMVKLLRKMGHSVYSPGNKTENLGDDDHEDAWKKSNVAIFGPDQGEKDGINELREWAESKRPSLYLIRGKREISSWPSSVTHFCKRIVCFEKDSELPAILKGFIRDVKLELKRPQFKPEK